MDKEEARFILSCFRPDGSDAADASFAEALQLAVADRELGEWLARERASDAAFAEALDSLPLPEGMRDAILAGLAAERGDLPVADEWDAPLIGALASVRPPAGLKDEILSAMKRSTTVEAPARRRWGWRLAVPLAAAAGVALALFAQFDRPGDSPGVVPGPVVSSGEVLPSQIALASIQTLEAPDFSLQFKDEDPDRLFRFIRSQGRACPQGCLPKGLRGVPGIGCRTLEINGKEGALVCFQRGQGDVVHMVVFKLKDVGGDLPERDHLSVEQLGRWAVVSWREQKRAFVILSPTTKEHLLEVF